MAFIPLPYGIKLEFYFTKDGQVCINVNWCAKLSPITVNPTDLAGAVAAGQTYWTNLRSSIHSGTTLNQIVATDWSVPDGGTSVIPSPSTPTGAVTGVALPNNVSIALAYLTGKRGRSQRGRNFIVGLHQGDLAGQNTLGTAAASDIVLAYQAFKTALNGAGLTPIVASFVSNGVARVTGQGTAITQVGFTDGTTDSQRRRLPGRGT